jgi:hypothetical protein
MELVGAAGAAPTPLAKQFTFCATGLWFRIATIGVFSMPVHEQFYVKTDWFESGFLMIFLT